MAMPATASDAASASLDADFAAGFRPPRRWPSGQAPTLPSPQPLRSHRFSLNARAAPPPPSRRSVPAGPPPPLPAEVYCTILSLCAPKDAARAAQSCRAWRTAFRCPGSWVTLDLTAAGPFGGESGANDASAALTKFLAFVVADGGVRLGCLETLAIEHSGGTEAQLRAERAERGSRWAGTLSWEAAAAVVAAASPSLRTLTLRGPPPGGGVAVAGRSRPLLRTGATLFSPKPRPVLCSVSL